MEYALGFTASLVAVAIATEKLTELVKTLIPESIKLEAIHKQAIAMVIAISLSFLMNIQLLDGPAAIAGTFLAGIIASRGANFTHEVIRVLEGLNTSLKKSK